MKPDRFIYNAKLGTVIDTDTDEYVGKSEYAMLVNSQSTDMLSAEVRLDVLTNILNDFENRLRWYEERLNNLEH